MKAATAHAQAELLTEPATGVKELQTVSDDAAAGGLALVIERLAANPQVDVTKLEKIIELQERIIRHEAESAFNVAFAAMQKEIPTIIERAKTDKTSYAPLEDIIDPLRPILSKHGFSLGFRSEWPSDKTVKVIGILTHERGHARQSEFVSVADQTGSKNPIQALASTVSYGKRYATKDLLCIVTRGEDDDAERAGRGDAPDAPKGFEAWGLELEAATVNGTAALMKAFNSGAEPLRLHLVKQHKASWESLKVRAADVTKKGGRS